jgi:hypothetical protein
MLWDKYASAIDIFASAVGGSQFWHNLNKIKHLFKWGTKFILGNAERIQWRFGWWIGESPPWTRFQLLFDTCSELDASIVQSFRTGAWDIRFCRTFVDDGRAQWDLLLEEIQVLTPNDNKDRIYCALEPFGQNSGVPQYKAMCQGSPFPLAKTIWSTKLPLKIRIFTCQFAIDRLPSSETYQQEACAD